MAANFALKDLKAKTAAVLYDVGNDYSKGLAEVFKATFEKGKGSVVAYESYQKDDVDFSALVTKVARQEAGRDLHPRLLQQSRPHCDASSGKRA